MGFVNSGPRWDMHKNAGVLNMLFWTPTLSILIMDLQQHYRH